MDWKLDTAIINITITFLNEYNNSPQFRIYTENRYMGTLSLAIVSISISKAIGDGTETRSLFDHEHSALAMSKSVNFSSEYFCQQSCAPKRPHVPGKYEVTELYGVFQHYFRSVNAVLICSFTQTHIYLFFINVFNVYWDLAIEMSDVFIVMVVYWKGLEADTTKPSGIWASRWQNNSQTATRRQFYPSE